MVGPTQQNPRKRRREGESTGELSSGSGRRNNNAGRGSGNRRGGRGRGSGGRGTTRQDDDEKGRNNCRGRPKNSNYNRHHEPVARTVSTTSSSDASSSIATIKTILPWLDPTTHYIAIEEEQQMLPVLVHWGRKERGMMKDQPPFRLQKIQKVLTQIQRTSTRTQHISLIQSLSLRRHHLKLLNPKFNMQSLRLGNGKDIKMAATQFEVCVETYLRKHNIPFLTEAEQKRHHRKDAPTPPTPDFMIKNGHEVLLSLDAATSSNTSATSLQQQQQQQQQQHLPAINWVEAKMFYGADTVPSGTSNAVGCILPKMQQYVSVYGAGAIIFMYGCGSQLAAKLLDIGVVALDGRGLDLQRVENHQRKWCADAWGNILF